VALASLLGGEITRKKELFGGHVTVKSLIVRMPDNAETASADLLGKAVLPSDQRPVGHGTHNNRPPTHIPQFFISNSRPSPRQSLL
jgi:hypothetical protein